MASFYDLPIELMMGINSYLDVYSSARLISTCSMIRTDLARVKPAKPAFYKENNRFYIVIPEFTKPYEVNTDGVYFKKVSIEYRFFPDRYPDATIKNNIYIEDNDYYHPGSSHISVSEESYNMVKKSYAEYLLQKKIAQKEAQ